jgi:hypothetical protein
MPRRYITVAEQQQIIERAKRRCEYCKCLMDYSSQAFELEHIIPIAEEGETELENLALACGGCNGHKYTKVAVFDPISKTQVPLYHPRRQVWQEHFAWSADHLEIIGLTAIGKVTIELLNLNRPGVINLRKLLLTVGLHPPDED